MTLSRRDFIKTSAFAGGGLLLGFSLPRARGAAGAQMPAGQVYAPNAWVHITPDNTITLICARSEMGQGVYTALPMLIAEELNVDLNAIHVEMAPANPALYTNALLGVQMTGGSTSVRDAWESLRVAGAQARMLLIAAAAQKWRVEPPLCRAEKGFVLGPDNRKTTYGDLADAAARMPLPANVALKDPKDFRIVGKATKRIDTPAKVNGTAVFGLDVTLPGMVYASLEQCPVIGGKVKSFDATAARAMPGVIDVVQITDGVAVVADAYWRAVQARRKLTVQWDEGTRAGLTNAVMIAGIRDAEKTGRIQNIEKTGDAAAALRGAKTVVRAEYLSQLLAHAAMEPMNFTADYQNGKCLLIGSIQFQQGGQSAAATALGIKPEDVTLKTTFLGGGFGRRLDYDYAVQAAQISKAVGKPVKLVWTREDDTTHDVYRPMALHRMAAGLDANGRPVALTFQLTSQSITERLLGLPKDTLDSFMTEAAVGPYDIPNTTHDLINHDAGLPPGYWRSVSHALNAFANESFIDELALAAKKDPYVFRLELLEKQPRFARVLKLTAEKAGWNQPAPEGHTRGLALMAGYDTYMAQVHEISVKDNQITVHRVVTVTDAGRLVNPDTVLAQIESGIIFGLSAALKGNITLDKGRVQQTNFHDYPVLRMPEVPKIEITLLESTEKPGGIGEPATALVAPALANALAAATGKRVRQLPLSQENIARTKAA